MGLNAVNLVGTDLAGSKGVFPDGIPGYSLSRLRLLADSTCSRSIAVLAG
jgi:hypothetical protein